MKNEMNTEASKVTDKDTIEWARRHWNRWEEAREQAGFCMVISTHAAAGDIIAKVLMDAGGQAIL